MKLNRKSLCRTLLPTLVVVAAVGSGRCLMAQAQAPTGANPVVDRLKPTESLIVEFASESNDFHNAIEKLVVPPTEELRVELTAKLKSIRDVIPEVVRNPQDIRVQAKYESAVSDALAMTVRQLQEFEKVRPGVMEAVAQARSGGEKTLAALIKQGREEKDRVADQRRQADAIDQKLHELGQQLNGLLTSGAPIPTQIDHLVQVLNMQRDTLLKDAEISATVVSIVDGQAEMVRDYLAAIDVQRGEIERVFTAASSQQLLLTHISQLRSLKLAGLKTSREMQEVFARMATFRKSMGDLINGSQMVFEVADFSKIPLPDFKPLKNGNDQSTRDILLKALRSPRSTTSEATPVAKK